MLNPSRSMENESYVLITAARNEEATVEATICSVLNQEILPKEWVIVSDGSTDGTDEILRRYARKEPFIKHLQLQGRTIRNFSSQVFAIQTGYRALSCQDYEYLGLLDADLRFPAHYYGNLMSRFREDLKRGIIGGLVIDVADGDVKKTSRNLNEVAGATQFFRRSCYEAQGGLLPIPEGGYDAIACARARMDGYKTETFPDLLVDHLKVRNAAFGGPIRRNWQLGTRDHALAYHPLFELMKCCSRAADAPFLVGSAAWFLGYVWSTVTGRQIVIPLEVQEHIRREQMKRICSRLMFVKARE